MNEIPDNDPVFSVKDLAHEVVEKFSPRFFARGSESLVYVPVREGREMVASVIKVNVSSVAGCVQWLEANPEADLDEFMDKKRELYNEWVEDGDAARSQAAHYFGEESVLPERTFFMKVPATPDLLKAALSQYEETSYDHTEVAALVTIQPVHLEIMNQDNPGICAGFLEVEEEAEVVGKLNHKFAFRPLDTFATRDDINKVLYSPASQALLELIESDEEIEKIVSKFVRGAINYTVSTGKILDLAGENNVTLLQPDDKDARLVISDGIYVDPTHKMRQLAETVAKTSEGISADELANMVYTLRYIRTINALASFLDEEGRLDMFSSMPQFDSAQWSKNFGTTLTQYFKESIE